MDNYSRFIDYLLLFSKTSLEKYIGEDILEQLMTEWEKATRGPVTKRDLAEMIIRLSGVSILRNSEFRKDLLFHMDVDAVDDIYNKLPQAVKNDVDIEKKIEAISIQKWGASAVNDRFVSYLGISKKIFEKKEVDDSVITSHQSMKRFFELLDYQFVIKQRILYELRKQNELVRMLVHMPTGTGKTKTMMHTLIHFYNFEMNHDGLIIWLAHTTELLQQAYETFSNVWTHLGNGTITSYKVWGNRSLKKASSYEGMMFCGIQKLQAIRQSNPAVFEIIVRSARLVVFDEAHKAAATETRLLIEELMVKKPGMSDRALIGLTATPGRTTLSSDENKLLSNMFERRIISIDIDAVTRINLVDIDYRNTKQDNNVIAYFQKERILSKVVKEQLTYEEVFSQSDINKIKVTMTANGYMDYSKESLELIGKNRSRNTSIIKKLRELSAENIPTIVFACSVSHAKLISYMLSLENINNALVLGEMNVADREESITRFKDPNNSMNIIINYEVLTTGFDSTNIQCVFITRPTQSIVLYSQMLGRGLRGPRMGGNEKCLLVDIKDNLGKFDADMAFEHFESYWSNC